MYNYNCPKDRKGNFKMKIYYWMHKEFGYIIPETDLAKDAEEMGYDDIIDPCSVEYGNFNLYYEKTNLAVKYPPFPITFFRCTTSNF